MTESVSCGQLFARRSEWQEKAFNELKDKLTATRDNRLLKYQDEDETFLVMILREIPNRKNDSDSEADRHPGRGRIL